MNKMAGSVVWLGLTLSSSTLLLFLVLSRASPQTNDGCTDSSTEPPFFIDCYTQRLDIFLILSLDILPYKCEAFFNDVVDMFFRQDEELTERVRFAAAFRKDLTNRTIRIFFDFHSNWTKAQVRNELFNAYSNSDELNTHTFSYRERNDTDLIIIILDRDKDLLFGDLKNFEDLQNASIYQFIPDLGKWFSSENNDNMEIYYRYYDMVEVLFYARSRCGNYNFPPRTFKTFSPSDLCIHCPDGWVRSSDLYDDDSVRRSCYGIFITRTHTNIFQFKKICEEYNAHPVSLETIKELKELEKLVFEERRVQHVIALDGEFHIFIGLWTKFNNLGVSYQWDLNDTPLYYNNWNPHREFRDLHDCTDWVFSHDKANNVSESWWQSIPCCPGSKAYICEISQTTVPGSISNIKARGTPNSSLLQKIRFGSSMYWTSYDEVLSPMNWLFFFRIPQIKTLFARGTYVSELDVPMFSCSHEWQTISYSKVCNGENDCPNASDELICPKEELKVCTGQEKLCKISNKCIPGDQVCDFVVDCPDGSDENDCQKTCRYFTCDNGVCLPNSLLWDGAADCKECSASDELIRSENRSEQLDYCLFWCHGCVTLTQLNDGIEQCTGDLGPIDEILGTVPAFNCTPNRTENTTNLHSWAPECIYIRDDINNVIGCRDLSHLENCASYQCPPKFYKCEKVGYCIPLLYMFDGVHDCLYGDDESYTVLFYNVFVCSSTRSAIQVLDPSQVCDGRDDCRYGEDEDSCAACPPGLLCGAGVVQRFDKNGSISTPLVLNSLDSITKWTRFVDLSNVNLSQIFPPPFSETKGQTSYLIYIYVSNSGIKTLDDGYSPEHNSSQNYRRVFEADFSNNDLQTISNVSILSRMQMLHALNLSSNVKLSDIQKDGINCSRLKILDVSYTALNTVPMIITHQCMDLHKLNLTGCPLVRLLYGELPKSLKELQLNSVPHTLELEPGVFRGMDHLTLIQTDLNAVCCPVVLSESVNPGFCYTSKTTFSSCSDLVSETFLKILLWLMGLVAGLGNLGVLVFRVFRQRETLRTSYGKFVTHLNVADLLMSVYLLIIAGSDVSYRGTFVWEAEQWLTSVTCKTAGYLSTLSLETSTIFIFLITLDRFLILQFPLGGIRFTPKACHITCAVVWVLTLVTSAVPLFPGHEDWKIISSNAMCLAIPLMKAGDPGWIFASAVFVGANSVLFFLIAVGQVAIYKAMKRKRVKGTKNLMAARQRQREIEVAKRLALVVISNFCCWLPIGLMSIVSLSEGLESQDAFAWSAILVMPLNSALNPVVYTLPAILLHFRSKKHAQETAQDRSVASSPERSVSVSAITTEMTNGSNSDLFKDALERYFENLSPIDNENLKAEKLTELIKKMKLSEENLELLYRVTGGLKMKKE